VKLSKPKNKSHPKTNRLTVQMKADIFVPVCKEEALSLNQQRYSTNNKLIDHSFRIHQKSLPRSNQASNFGSLKVAICKGD
jgi:hypothetical protein